MELCILTCLRKRLFHTLACLSSTLTFLFLGSAMVTHAQIRQSLYIPLFDSGTIRTVGLDGMGMTSINGLQHPVCIAFDLIGNMFVNDLPLAYQTGPTTVRKIDLTGTMTTFATLDRFSLASTFDTQGNLFVTRYAVRDGAEWDNRVSKIDLNSVVTLFATVGNGPNGVAFDASGLLYVSEWTGGLRVISPDGTIGTLATGLNIPAGLAFDAVGNLYVSEAGGVAGHGRILKYTFSSPGVVSGTSTFVEDNGLDRPAGLAFDQDGNLYVVNIGFVNPLVGYTILKITPNGTVSTFLTLQDSPEGIVIYPPPASPQYASIGGHLSLEGASNQAQPVTFALHPSDGSGDFSRTVRLAIDSSYVLSGLPRKAYSVRVKGAMWLAKVFSVDTTGGDVGNLTATLKTGDANSDNVVDIGDLLLLIAHYNQVAPASGYLEAADFNLDGVNDITDLLLLIGNYNQMGDS